MILRTEFVENAVFYRDHCFSSAICLIPTVVYFHRSNCIPWFYR